MSGRTTANRWESLCTPCVAEIVSTLDPGEPLTKAQIFESVGRSRQTVHRALKMLISQGFVEVDQESRFPRRKFHVLTPTGRSLASTPLSSLPQVSTMRKE